MAPRRILLLGDGDLTEETSEALAAASADVQHLANPDVGELREALARGADAVAVVSRDDAWPLRAALLVRHLEADVPIVATWFKLVISVSMLVALLFAAAFTGGLVERLIGRNLTGLLGRRAVPRSDHVVVVGLGQVGLRLCMLLRECGVSVVAIDDQPDGENVGHARRLGLPVVIGRGADPSLLRRLSLSHAMALAAVTADDLQNIKVTLTARAEAPDLRVVLRAGSNATGGETRSLERLGHVRDVHRIGAVYIAGVTLGSAAAHVVVDGDTAHLRDRDGGLERCPYPVAG